MDAADGTPGLHSGELLFRANGLASSQVLPNSLFEWLGSSDPCTKASEDSCQASLNFIREMRKKALQSRNARIKMIQSDHVAGPLVCKLALQRTIDAGQRACGELDDALECLDSRLIGLVLRFGKLLDVERKVATHHLRFEARLCAADRRHQAFAQRLGLFALHL
jgi:hypothetical protein